MLTCRGIETCQKLLNEYCPLIRGEGQRLFDRCDHAASSSGRFQSLARAASLNNAVSCMLVLGTLLSAHIQVQIGGKIWGRIDVDTPAGSPSNSVASCVVWTG